MNRCIPCSGGSTGVPEGLRPTRNFLGPFLGPHFPRRVQNFEFRIYCLLKILANGKDVQGMNMILLDNYCTLTYAKCRSSFLCVFWLYMQATTYRKFLSINGDLAFVFSVMLSPCTFYFYVILPALLHFCSFIFTAFRV